MELSSLKNSNFSKKIFSYISGGNFQGLKNKKVHSGRSSPAFQDDC